MYPPTKSAIDSSGTVARRDGTRDISKGPPIHTLSPVLQVSAADFTASEPEHNSVPLELATSSPCLSTAYLHDGAPTGTSSLLLGYTHDGLSDGSLSVNADLILSTIEMEHFSTEAEDIPTEAILLANNHVGHETYITALSNPFGYLSITQSSSTSPLEIAQVAAGIEGTPATGASTAKRAILPTDFHSHPSHSQFQLQLWVYETSPSNQTLAEHLEQANWEDTNSRISTTDATSSTTNSALATYEAVMEDDWYVAAVL
ncbi:hypothetical protein BKA64DRAFT_105672 [Cadophora sp. MPI-SDFR-AT-0126]|nr:hypothetical protein BKA64DRAFT_105672 [Leotiomycetes sp. MPI-SDFR-AT-0126]